MISTGVRAALEHYVPAGDILYDEPLCRHTTFRIGGPADAFVRLRDTGALPALVGYIDQIGIPYFILGNGSNVLAMDSGYRGLVVQLAGPDAQIRVDGTELVCGAGAALARASQIAAGAGLTGMEFAAGIPGTVGGGVAMNAGAFGSDCGSVTRKVVVMDPEGSVLELDADTMEFGYRTSAIRYSRFIVCSVTFALNKGDPGRISSRMEEYAVKRSETQPLEYPSAGSFFKNPESGHAAQMIDECGLKGYQCGGAAVSGKHAGFIVNLGDATSDDVQRVAEHVQRAVFHRFGITLDPEVVYL